MQEALDFLRDYTHIDIEYVGDGDLYDVMTQLTEQPLDTSAVYFLDSELRMIDEDEAEVSIHRTI